MTTMPTEVDLIIVGAGTAGCIVAARFLKADPNLQILVIEDGGTNAGNPETECLGLWKNNLRPGSDTSRFLWSKPTEHVNQRSVYNLHGRGVGGSSLIHQGFYVRPVRQDLDDWNVDGWGYDDLVPYMKRAENYSEYVERTGIDYFGVSGPLKISMAGMPFSRWHEGFIDTATKSQGWRYGTNYYEFNKLGYLSPLPKTVDGVTGIRSTVAQFYLSNKVPSNLHILTETTVDKVIIENGRAVGVECVPSSNASSSLPPPKKYLARKLVALSAGNFNSPLILERSGVGNTRVLESVGINVIVELPGVGENYLEHLRHFNIFYCDKDIPSNVSILTQTEIEMKTARKELESKGKGILTTNMMDLAVRLRPSAEEISAMSLEFQEWWREKFVARLDLPLAVLAAGPCYDWGPTDFESSENYFTVGGYLCRPRSQGSIHLSSSSPYALPDFDPGYIREDVDVASCMWIYKTSRNVARNHPCFRGEVLALHPPFAAGSAAALRVREEFDTSSPKKHLGNVTYSSDDDAVLEAWVRDTVGPAGSLGTCSMKPRELGGVVDKDLNVYGIKGLKVCDVSIALGHVSCNLLSVAVLIGERGAAKIAEYLGINETLLL